MHIFSVLTLVFRLFFLQISTNPPHPTQIIWTNLTTYVAICKWTSPVKAKGETERGHRGQARDRQTLH